MTCSLVLNARAQVYAGDSWMQMPTADLYDAGTMNMYLRALAETEARRKENYQRYNSLAFDAYKNKQWNSVIYYVNMALETKYYSGQLYYIRVLYGLSGKHGHYTSQPVRANDRYVDILD